MSLVWLSDRCTRRIKLASTWSIFLAFLLCNVCHATNVGLLHNLKVALLDNVDIYGGTAVNLIPWSKIEIEIVYLLHCV